MIDKNVLEKALAEILGELLVTPLRYFSESDIHSIVYSELSKKSKRQRSFTIPA